MTKQVQTWDEVFDFPVYPEFDVDFEDNNLLFSNEETVPEDLHDLPSSGEGVHDLPSPGEGVHDLPRPGEGVHDLPSPGEGVHDLPSLGQGVQESSRQIERQGEQERSCVDPFNHTLATVQLYCIFDNK